MAVVHMAYTFDDIAFHQYLADKITIGLTIDFSTLYHLAIQAVMERKHEKDRLLEYIRYNDTWLETTDEDIADAYQWYLLILTSYLTPLDRQEYTPYANYEPLSQALLLEGWSNEDIKLLIQGQPLSTLVESSRNPLFIAEFMGGINQYGGWIPRETVHLFYRRIEEKVRTPQNNLKRISSVSYQTTTFTTAYTNIVHMLDVAFVRKHALFLIVD